MIGTADELAEQGITIPRPLSHSRARRPPLRRVIDAVRLIRDDINPMFYRALAVSLVAADRLDGVAAIRLPASTGDELDRRAVLHHRDHRHRRVRRLQLHAPAHVAADLGHRIDVRRRDHHRDPGRVHRRRAAVATLCPVGRPPQGAPSAPPRDRGRAGLVRRPGRQRSDRRRLRRGRHRARRRQPLPVHGRPPRRAGDLR